MATEKPVVRFHESFLRAKLPYQLKDIAKGAGGKWDPFNKEWVMQPTQDSIEALTNVAGLIVDLTAMHLFRPAQKSNTPVTKTAADPIADMLLKPGIIPMAHQVQGFNLALEKFGYGVKPMNKLGGGYALLHDPGCGKTLTAISIASRLHLDCSIQKIVVVCPVSVIPVWPMEWQKFSQVNAAVTILNGTVKNKEKQLKGLSSQGLNVVVTNYESLWRMDEVVAAWNPDMIICDESHRIKNFDSKQSKALHSLGQITRFRIIMTGTVITNKPLDVWSQFRFADPKLFASSYYAFRNRYATMGGFNDKVVVAYKKLNELSEKIYTAAHRVTKAEALDLPEYTDQFLYCTLEPKARNVYNQLKEDAVAELEGDQVITAPRIVTRILRLMQLTGGFAKADEDENISAVSTAKLDLLEDTLEDLLYQNKKIVIFARFVAELEAIGNVCSKLVGEENVRRIQGATPQSLRGKAVEDFQTDPNVKLFLAQTATAGLGITLHAADTCIFYSLDYNYGNYEQAKARIHRTGQRNACTAIHLLASKTIDEIVLETVQEKRDLSAKIIDDWRSLFK